MKRKIKVWLLGVVVAFGLTSCWSKGPESLVNSLVFNATDDTLTVTNTYWPNGRRVRVLPPHCYFLSMEGELSMCEYMELIPREFEKDTMRVYRGDSLMITWCPPLRAMEAGMHSFYNPASWDDEENEWLSIFTITEEDYGHCF